MENIFLVFAQSDDDAMKTNARNKKQQNQNTKLFYLCRLLKLKY
jgi:hypothetical protein